MKSKQAHYFTPAQNTRFIDQHPRTIIYNIIIIPIGLVSIVNAGSYTSAILSSPLESELCQSSQNLIKK